jgi:uncharacterized delta-60 repeat protein
MRLTKIRLPIALLVAALVITAAQAWAAAGGLDHSFSGDGKATIGFANGSGDDEGRAMAIQRDGKIIVAGFADTATAGENFAVVRLKIDGSLDHSFSGDGKTTFGFGNGTGDDVAHSIAVQPNGKIVLAGDSYQGPSKGDDMSVARLNAGGSLDHSFSGDGKMTFGFANGSEDDDAGAVALQRDGKIVVSGFSVLGPGGRDAVTRVKPGGGLDHSFSGDGKKTFGFPGGIGDATAEGGVAIRGDGKIVVAGASNQGATGDDFALARLNPNGGFDHTFSGDGRATLDFVGTSDVGRGMAIQRDGKIVVAGNSNQGAAANQLAIARFKANGSPDHTFSGDGRKAIGFGNPTGNDQANGVALQHDGKIVAAGVSDQTATGLDFAVARFTTNGGLDSTFSGDGRKTIAFGSGDDFGRAVAIQGNGRIVVAGIADLGASGENFALARLLGS